MADEDDKGGTIASNREIAPIIDEESSSGFSNMEPGEEESESLDPDKDGGGEPIEAIETAREEKADRSPESRPRRLGRVISIAVFVFGLVLTFLAALLWRYISPPPATAASWAAWLIWLGLLITLVGLVSMFFN